jgi:hypothetical protein
LALKSIDKSTNAGNEAKNVKDKLKNGVQSELSKLKNQIAKFEKYYKHLALGRSTINALTKGKPGFLKHRLNIKRVIFSRLQNLQKKLQKVFPRPKNRPILN